jgi:hypothetical protein
MQLNTLPRYDRSKSTTGWDGQADVHIPYHLLALREGLR